MKTANELYAVIDATIGYDVNKNEFGFVNSPIGKVSLMAKVAITALKNGKYEMAKRAAIKIALAIDTAEVFDVTRTLIDFAYAVAAEADRNLI